MANKRLRSLVVQVVGEGKIVDLHFQAGEVEVQIMDSGVLVLTGADEQTAFSPHTWVKLVRKFEDR